MTDVFRSEILAVVMQQIVDEPVLPVLFLRTVSCFSHSGGDSDTILKTSSIRLSKPSRLTSP